MAYGGMYLMIPEADKNKPVPDKIKNNRAKKFEQPVLDSVTGEPIGEVEVIHPSWLGAANKFRQEFGAVVDVTYRGKNYKLIELELSYEDGEFDEIARLQPKAPGSKAPGSKGPYMILNNTQAQQVVRGIDPFE